MKKVILCLFSCVIVSVLFSESIEINFGQNSAKTIKSNNSNNEYSIFKLIDSDKTTCMAVTKESLSFNKGLLFEFKRVLIPNKITGFVICPGFFDQKYYSKNSRIKRAKVNIEIEHFNKITGGYSYEQFNQEFTFQDIMSQQTITLKKTIIGTIVKFDFIVLDVYPGEKWQDVCVSDFSFLDNKEVANSIISLPHYTTIEWIYQNGKPIQGNYRSDHSEGRIDIIYSDGRLTSINRYEYSSDDGTYILCEKDIYNYEDKTITVVEESTNQIECIYTLNNDNKLLSEERCISNTNKIIFKYIDGQESSDNIREYITTNNALYRLDYSSVLSEMNILDNDKRIIKSYRESFNDYLLPIEFIMHKY